jgi:hypothetical protein
LNRLIKFLNFAVKGSFHVAFPKFFTYATEVAFQFSCRSLFLEPVFEVL